MKLSLSSCWNSHRHEDGYEMIAEVVDLGFEYIELSHGIRISLVPGILKAVDEGLIKVSSVHNFCPLPVGITHAAPNLYEPTARRHQEHAMWFRNTLKTIDFAQRVGAELMVIHSGSVKYLFKSPEVVLEDYIGSTTPEELRKDREYEKLLQGLQTRMRKKQGSFRKQLIESYRKIIPAAKEKGIKVGVENREGFDEMPMDLEMRGLLIELGEPEVFGYWHDAGHAQLKERMGIILHQQLLADNTERQFGFHLHDVSENGFDHQAIGTGTIDWKMLRSFIREEHILVLELSPRLKKEEVELSRDFVKAELI